MNGKSTCFFSRGATAALLLVGACLIAWLVSAGCARREDGEEKARAGLGDVIRAEDSVPRKGDLEEIRLSGSLRILTPWMAEGHLPRAGYPPDFERELAVKFALSLGLDAVMVSVSSFENLVPALLAGRGDLIAANLTVLESRKKQIAFTAPVGYSREQVVASAGETSLKSLADLSGRTLGVQEQTSFMETAAALRGKHPGLKLKVLPGRLTTDELLDKVGSGEIDLTILDSNLLDVLLAYRRDVRAALDATGARALAWGVRRENPRLLEELNRFLAGEALTRPHENAYREDLPGIKKRKTLRVITSNTAATYFQWRGQLMGFEYEMAKKFAAWQELKLEIIVAPGHADMIPMLLEGRGDLVAAALKPTDARLAQAIAFSVPYLYASQMVVACSSEGRIKSLRDLAGRTIAVRRSSIAWQELEKIRAGGINFRMQPAPESMETEDILSKVAGKEYDLTVADSHLLDIERVWLDVKGVLAIGERQPCGWVVRAGDRELLAAVNAFWKKEYRGEHYNLAFARYFRIKPQKAGIIRKEMQTHSGRISRYDDLVKQYASRYKFEWRMNVAQMYQESRFDPRARSSAGARGLFQVLPSTAREMGFKQDLEHPPTGIHAGVKYLDFLRGYFEPQIKPEERIWFALASYNAGMGHVSDARRLARRLGLNPDLWFDNVEKAMLLLSKPEYARQARHGYVRGAEPVNYVREIRDRHKSYLQVTGD